MRQIYILRVFFWEPSCNLYLFPGSLTLYSRSLETPKKKVLIFLNEHAKPRKDAISDCDNWSYPINLMNILLNSSPHLELNKAMVMLFLPDVLSFSILFKEGQKYEKKKHLLWLKTITVSFLRKSPLDVFCR